MRLLDVLNAIRLKRSKQTASLNSQRGNYMESAFVLVQADQRVFVDFVNKTPRYSRNLKEAKIFRNRAVADSYNEIFNLYLDVKKLMVVEAD
jgi:hypothetical protein